MKLPYKPIIGKSFGEEGEFCTMGWCFARLFGRENIVEEGKKLRVKSIPSGTIFDTSMSNEIAKMNDTRDFEGAFKMLPGLINENAELFEKHGADVKGTLEEIRRVIND